MSDEFSIKCPKCRAKLKLKNRKLVGKKVPCPKCKKPFVVEEPAGSESSVSVEVLDSGKTIEASPPDSQFDILAEGIEEAEPVVGVLKRGEMSSGTIPAMAAPSSGDIPATAKTKPAKKQTSASGEPSSWKKPAIIGGACMAVLAVGGAIAVFALNGSDNGGSQEGGAITRVVGTNSNSEDDSVAAEDASAESDTSPPKADVAQSSPRAARHEPTLRSAVATKKSLDLSYLPANAELLVSLRVADAQKAPFAQTIINSPAGQAFFDYFREVIHYELDQIDSAVFALSGLSDVEKTQQIAATQSFKLGDLPGVCAVRTKEPVDPESLKSLTDKAERTTHHDKTYYHIPPPPNASAPLAAYFPEERMVVVGTEAEVKEIMERGDKAPARPDLAFVDASQHVLLVLVPQNPEAFTQKPPGMEAAPESLSRLQTILADNLAGLSLGITFSDDMAMQVRLNCRGEAGVDELHDEIDGGLTELRNSLAAALADLPEQFREFGELAERILNGARVAQADRFVQVSGAVPGTAMGTLTRLPGAAMQYMMTQSMEGMEGLATGEGNLGGANVVPGAGFPGGMPPGAVRPGGAADGQPAAGVGTGQLDSSWQVNKSIDGQTADDVLAELAQTAGLELEIEASQKRLIAKPVSLELENVSVVEAIEKVCAQVDALPEFSGNKLKVGLGNRRVSPAFAGPFMIIVDTLTESAPHTTGTLKLKAIAAGLPPNVLAVLRERMQSPVKVDQLVAEDGSDLAGDGRGAMSLPHESLYVHSLTLPLKGLLRDVTTIGIVRGTMQMPVPRDVATVRFDTIEASAVQQTGETTVTLESVEAGEQTTLHFEIDGIAPDWNSNSHLFIARDDAGKELEIVGSISTGGGDQAAHKLVVDGKPAAIDVMLVGSVADVTYPFELTGIPLRSYSSQPESVEPLDFAGYDAPVHVRFVDFAGEGASRMLRLRAINYANKDVRKLELRVGYFDASNNKLDETKLMQHGSATRSVGISRNLVSSKGAQEFHAPAHFIPDGTREVEVALSAAYFADGSLWSAVPRRMDSNVMLADANTGSDATVPGGDPAGGGQGTEAGGGGPDLTFEATELVANSPTRVTFKYIIKNAGTAGAPMHGPTDAAGDNVSVKVYLSDDETLDEETDRVGTEWNLANSAAETLEPEATHNGQYFINFTPRQPKPAFLIVQVDSENLVAEADESNNLSTIALSGPDAPAEKTAGKKKEGGLKLKLNFLRSEDN